jgi:hypothetical protein
VGDHQHAAGEPHQLGFQDLEREEVQVVGGLVQDQEVGLLQEQPGQEQAVPLPAGQAAHLLLMDLVGEEVAVQVAAHVDPLPAHLHPVLVATDSSRLASGSRSPGAGRSTRSGCSSPAPPTPLSGGSSPRIIRSSVVLPGAVRAHDPDPLASPQRGREVADQDPVAVRLGHAVQVQDGAAEAGRRAERQLRHVLVRQPLLLLHPLGPVQPGDPRLLLPASAPPGSA